MHPPKLQVTGIELPWWPGVASAEPAEACLRGVRHVQDDDKAPSARRLAGDGWQFTGFTRCAGGITHLIPKSPNASERGAVELFDEGDCIDPGLGGYLSAEGLSGGGRIPLPFAVAPP